MVQWVRGSTVFGGVIGESEVGRTTATSWDMEVQHYLSKVANCASNKADCCSNVHM